MCARYYVGERGQLTAREQAAAKQTAGEGDVVVLLSVAHKHSNRAHKHGITRASAVFTNSHHASERAGSVRSVSLRFVLREVAPAVDDSQTQACAEQTRAAPRAGRVSSPFASQTCRTSCHPGGLGARRPVPVTEGLVPLSPHRSWRLVVGTFPRGFGSADAAARMHESRNRGKLSADRPTGIQMSVRQRWDVPHLSDR